MNPDLLALLRRAFAPDATAVGKQPTAPPPSAAVTVEPGTPENVRNLMTSPTADSLYAIAGAPKNIGRIEPEREAVDAGAYFPSADRALLNPYATDASMFSDMDRPGHSTSYANESWSPRMTLAHEAGHRYQHKKGTPPSSSWASEKYADAFAKAFDLLSKTGTPKDTADIEQRLTDMESKYPGTRKMLSNMLRSESQLFAGHPLQMLPDRMGNLDLISKYPTDVMGTPAQRKKTASAPVIKSRMEDVLKNMLIPQTP